MIQGLMEDASTVSAYQKHIVQGYADVCYGGALGKEPLMTRHLAIPSRTFMFLISKCPAMFDTDILFSSNC